MLENIHTIKVEHPKTPINLTFWQKIKLLFGKDVILYIDTQVSVSNGLMIVHSKPIIEGSAPDIKLKDNQCQGK